MKTDLIIDLLAKEGRHIEAGWVKDIPMGRLARPSELQGTIVWMASDASSYLNGSDIVRARHLKSLTALHAITDGVKRSLMVDIAVGESITACSCPIATKHPPFLPGVLTLRFQGISIGVSLSGIKLILFAFCVAQARLVDRLTRSLSFSKPRFSDIPCDNHHSVANLSISAGYFLDRRMDS